MKNSLVILVLLFAACKKESVVPAEEFFIVSGKVEESGTGIPLQRTIEIYELIGTSALWVGTTYSSQNVNSVQSNSDGTFQIKVKKSSNQLSISCKDLNGPLCQSFYGKALDQSNSSHLIQFPSSCGLRFSCSSNAYINSIYINTIQYGEDSVINSIMPVAELNPQFGWGTLSEEIRSYGGNEKGFMVQICDDGITCDSSYIIIPNIPTTGTYTINIGY